MATEFTMPKLGLTMEEGTIVEWLLPEGADVEAGVATLIVTTDKVETEVEAPASGRLHLIGGVGASFRCGERIAMILDPGEEDGQIEAHPGDVVDNGDVVRHDEAGAAMTAAASVPLPAAATNGRRGRILSSPNARRVAASRGVDLSTVLGTGPNGRIVAADVEQAADLVVEPDEAAATLTPAVPAASPRATAAALQLADLLGVDVDKVVPSSTNGDGRVSRRDVAEYVRVSLTTSNGNSSANGIGGAPPPHAVQPLTQEPTKVIPLRGMRGTIANRMVSSLQQMAQLTLTMDVAMDAVVADRAARQARGASPGYTDYVIAAVARALRQHPVVNSQVTADGVALLPDIHVGLAVALDDGLLVPVVRNADRLLLDAIAAETSRLADAARRGTVGLSDVEGATFSVTSLGMFGVDTFTPVINPPNTAILGVGRIRGEIDWSDDGIRRVRRATLSLTWDHRAFDGAPAAMFCQSVRDLLEAPASLP